MTYELEVSSLGKTCVETFTKPRTFESAADGAGHSPIPFVLQFRLFKTFEKLGVEVSTPGS